MKRFVNYSDVFEIDFGATGDVKGEIAAFKELMMQRARTFLDLDFTDVFLTIATETSNDGTISVYAHVLATDAMVKTLQDVQSFSSVLYRSIVEPNERELVLAYHLSTTRTSLVRFKVAFNDLHECSSVEDYLYFLAHHELYIPDCLFRNLLNKLYAFTSDSCYTMESVYGFCQTLSLTEVAEEDLAFDEE